MRDDKAFGEMTQEQEEEARKVLGCEECAFCRECDFPCKKEIHGGREMKNNDGVYIAVFAIKDGVRYNAQVISLNDVTKILTNSLLDGVQEIIMPKKSEDTE